MMKSLLKGILLLMLAGSTLGGVQKRVYVLPGHPDLGGNADDTNGPVQGQHHGRHHVILRQFACILEISCGGSLLSPDWVITAAHCDSWFLRAVLNSHPDYSQRQVRRIAEKHFCCDNGQAHDLLLLRLKPKTVRGQPVQFPTISLPTLNSVKPGLNQRVRFYGRMDATLTAPDPNYNNKQKMNSIRANRLRFGNIPVVDCLPGRPNDCPRLRNCPYTPGFCICVQDPHVAANQGDSGGSLVWRGPGQQHDILYGVLNFGPTYLDDGSEKFKDISNPLYRNWIHSVTGL